MKCWAFNIDLPSKATNIKQIFHLFFVVSMFWCLMVCFLKKSASCDVNQLKSNCYFPDFESNLILLRKCIDLIRLWPTFTLNHYMLAVDPCILVLFNQSISLLAILEKQYNLSILINAISWEIDPCCKIITKTVHEFEVRLSIFIKSHSFLHAKKVHKA